MTSDHEGEYPVSSKKEHLAPIYETQPATLTEVIRDGLHEAGTVDRHHANFEKTVHAISDAFIAAGFDGAVHLARREGRVPDEGPTVDVLLQCIAHAQAQMERMREHFTAEVRERDQLMAEYHDQERESKVDPGDIP